MDAKEKIKKLAVCLLLGSIILGGGGCSMFGGKPSGRRAAERLVGRMVDSLGGGGTLDDMRYLTFDFTIEHSKAQVLRRAHTWDRKTGRYRMEGIFPDGKPYVALFNTNTRQGQVFVGNKLEPLADPTRALEEIYHFYQGDTAWLLGLFRLRAPGVELSDTGQAVITGKSFEVLSAVADGPAAGTLPGTQNWVYLDPESAQPFAWSLVPAGQTGRVSYLFAKFQGVGKMQLPVRLERLGGPWAIAFNYVLPMQTISDNVFTSVAEPSIEKIKPLESGELPLPMTGTLPLPKPGR